MVKQKNYWQNRTVNSGSRLGIALKRSNLTRSLANFLFSVRTADEAFLARVLADRKVSSLLDVACGAGKSLLPARADYVVGVDIRGYPKQLALAKGYSECVEYDPPGYEFDIGKSVDAATIINLNAHISQKSYKTILERTLDFVRPGGVIILVHEYNNHGFSYRWMKRKSDKFDNFVKGMEHWHLGYETDFMSFAGEQLSKLRLRKRTPLTAGLLPTLHYYAYLMGRNPGPLIRRALILFDIPISILNNLQRMFSHAFNESFLVGYVYEKLR